MGIHDLLPFLRKESPLAFKSFAAWFENNKKLKEENIKIKVAIDVPIFMYKFCYALGTTGVPLINRMLKFNNELIEKNLDPIFIFDGKSLEAKNEERAKRFVSSLRTFELKQLKYQTAIFYSQLTDTQEEFEVERTVVPSGRPLKEDFEALKLAFDLANINYKTAKYEAEALCSKLCNIGEVDGIITEDSDSLAYLCESVIINWNNEKEEVVNAKIAASQLQLTNEQFQDLCVLLGNDFNSRIKGLGPVKAYSALKKNGTLEKVLEMYPKFDFDNKERMYYCKSLFKNHCFEDE